MEGLKTQLESSDEELEITGLAKNGPSLFKILEHSTPDVLLLDYEMEEMNGYEVIRKME